MTTDNFRHWKVDGLRKYCQQRGFTTTSSKRKDELVALAYAAYTQNVPIVSSKDKEKTEAKQQYSELLTLDDGTVIPGAFEDERDKCICEAEGIQHWPLCMIINISDYLIARNERPLCTRLGKDYKRLCG